MSDNCFECGKAISSDEFVVNWGSCSDCFDASYIKYMHDTRWRRRWNQFIGFFKKDVDFLS